MVKKNRQQINQQRKDNPEEWKKKKIGTIAYMVLMIIYGFYTMIVGISAYAKFDGVIDTFTRIIDNLNMEPIVDIEYKGTSNCNSGWDPLYEFNWGGTSSGCNCLNAPNTASYDGVNRQLYSGSCSTNQTSAGCGEVNSIAEKTFQNWNVNGNGQNVCIKRLKGKSYYKNAPKQSSCKSGEKECGLVSENENSIYCVKSGELCPIYDFFYDGAGNQDHFLNGFEEIVFSSSSNFPQSLYAKRTGKTAPISEIRITGGSGVCLDNNAQNLANGQSEYVLMADKRKRCSKTDKRFDRLDEANTELQWYDANNVLNQLNNLPEFTASTYEMYTYQRPFLDWNLESRDELESLIDRKDTIESMSSTQLIVMVINIIVCIVVSIFLSISQIYNLLGKDVPCISGDGEEEQQRIKKLKKIWQYGAKALQFPFIIWAFALATDNKAFIRGLADDKVSDAQTNKELGDLATLIEDDVFMADVQLFVALLFVILIDVGFWFKRRSDKQKKKGNQVNKVQHHDEEVQQADEPEKAVQQQQTGSQQQSYQQMPPQQQMQTPQAPMGMAQPQQYDPSMSQPGYQQPMGQPGYAQPGMPPGQPGYAQPGMPGQSGYAQPGMPGQPGYAQPGMPPGQPGYAQPGMQQPGMPGYQQPPIQSQEVQLPPE